MSLTPEQATRSLDAYRDLNAMTDAEFDGAMDDGFGEDVPTSGGVASRMALNLAQDAPDWWRYFASMPLQESYTAYLELEQLPAHERERDLLERSGADGRVKG